MSIIFFNSKMDKMCSRKTETPENYSKIIRKNLR